MGESVVMAFQLTVNLGFAVYTVLASHPRSVLNLMSPLVANGLIQFEALADLAVGC
jgi:hypothetical protein